MSNLVELNRQKIFTYSDAQCLLPVIFRITRQQSERVEAHIQRIESLGSNQDKLINGIEAEINSEVQSWQEKLKKLGAQPKGLWVADFDSGDGYFCWKYPETKIEFWHRYADGFSGRIPIEKYLKSQPVQASEASL